MKSQESLRKWMREDAHFVLFHESDGELITEVSDFLGGGLQEGCTAIVIATDSHLEGIGSQMRSNVPHMAASAFYKKQYIAINAEKLLSEFMVDGWPDEQRFTETVGALLLQAAQVGCGRIVAFGEMVALLVEQGNAAAAIRLEDLWNTQAAHYSFSLLCAYSAHSFRSEASRDALTSICGAHSHIHLSRPAENHGRKAH